MGRVQRQSQRKFRRFPGGARRTDRKPRFDLIPFEFLESIARSAYFRGRQVRGLQLEARAEGLLPRRLEPRLRASPEIQGRRPERRPPGAPGVQRGVPDLGGEEGRNLAGGFHSLDVGRSPNSLI